jgi:phosphoribosylanthranilate isomerase
VSFAVLVHIKVCCIATPSEAQRAVAAGASAIGLVSAMPSGPGVIDEALIAHIAGKVPLPAQTFLLTAHQRAEAIAAQHARCGTTTIQLVDAVAPEELRQLREALPSVALVQVIHVVNEASVDEAMAAAAWVDALLLDSGNPNAAVKELGGTGRTHNWDLSRRIVEASPVPVWLAGGLNPGNAAQAIRAVRPYGLDICSGLRTDGALDDAKLHAFVQAVRAA